MERKSKYSEGNFFKIPLGDNTHSYGRILRKGSCGIHDIRTTEEMLLDDIEKHPFLFEIGIMKYAFTSRENIFPIIGFKSLTEDLQKVKNQFIYDSLGNRLKIYLTETGEIRRSTWEEVKDLEICAAYDPHHVVERLNDYFAGRPNAFIERHKTILEKFRPKA